ncbi:exodeoxyribonuclease III [bacterium]|nr:exodeoxyribonuclease III [bacterium]
MRRSIVKLLSWNVNGYRAAWKKGFKEWLAKENPDIVCLQETKAWEEQLTKEQREPLGYHSAFSKPERKGYSGVGTFSKKPPARIEFGYDIPRFDSEGRVLLTDHGSFLLANIYFPNGKKNQERLKYKLDFYDETLAYFSRLRDAGRELVIVGDYNTAHKPIDLARPKENEKISGFLPEERAWLDQWVEAGFVDIFREFETGPDHYTWWDMRTRARDRNIGWRIDYFFVSENMKDRVRAAWILPDVMGSDHCPLGIEIDE